RKGGGRVRDAPGAVAVAEGVNALVLDDAVEVAQHLLPGILVVGDQLGEGLLRGLRDGGASRVEVAHEPLEGEPVDQRNDRIGDGGEGEREGYDEAQRKRHGAPGNPIIPSKVCARCVKCCRLWRVCRPAASRPDGPWPLAAPCRAQTSGKSYA